MNNSRYLALCYIINSKDADFLQRFGPEYYQDYDLDKKTGNIITIKSYDVDYKAIQNHYNKYSVIPTATELITSLPKDSILADLGIEETSSPADYYAKRLIEEYTQNKAILTINKSGKDLATQPVKATAQLCKDITDIMAKTSINLTSTSFSSKKTAIQANFNKQLADPMTVYSTGLTQLDTILDGGFRSNEELVVIFARTNVGKSWWSLKFALEFWKQGLNVGFFSPEMSESIVWNRLITLNSHASNRALNKPYNSEYDSDDFDYFLSSLPCKGDMHVVDMSTFNDIVTVDKLEQWIKVNKLNALFLDGISYITANNESDLSSWERPGQITRQLMALSVKLNIPIIIVAQANRQAVTKDKDGRALTEVPTLDTIANSDQIVQHASRVIGIGRGIDDESNLYALGVIKNRYGDNNTQVRYRVDINTGKFLDESVYNDSSSFNCISTYSHGDYIII